MTVLAVLAPVLVALLFAALLRTASVLEQRILLEPAELEPVAGP